MIGSREAVRPGPVTVELMLPDDWDADDAGRLQRDLGLMLRPLLAVLPNVYDSESGDCYVVSYHAMEIGSGRNWPGRWRVVHGLVRGKGVKHGHAWIEFSCGGKRWAMDLANGRRMVTLVSKYRELGQVEDAREYTFRQLARQSLKEETFGPWHHDGDPVPLKERRA
jgi:hypothetical protein